MPWALDMKDFTELSSNECENMDLDREVDSSSELNTQNSDVGNDIYLSQWKEPSKSFDASGELASQSESRDSVKPSEKSTNVEKQQLSFHPASQIKLYNKSTNKAALIRHGHYHQGLISVVIDMCFSHYGKASDWQQAESVALSINELLTIYGQFMGQRSVNIDLNFHAQTTSPVNIMVTADKLIIKSGALHLSGKTANKVKFMALVESALKTYVQAAFPQSTFEEFTKFY